jgi:hypothetical protein
MRVAVYTLKHTRDGLEWFASAEDTAFELSCSENAVHISRKRLVKAGFLFEVAETYEDAMREGRPANRYRIPDTFPNGGWGKGKEVSTTVDGENKSPDSGVSQSVDEEVSTTVDGAIRKSVRGKTPKASSPHYQNDSDRQKESDHSEDDYGGSGAHERPQPPITAAESSQDTASQLKSERERLEPWERPPPQWLEDLWAGGTLQSEADGGEDLAPSGGLEFDADDSFAWNAVAFFVAEKFPRWIAANACETAEVPYEIWFEIARQFQDYSPKDVLEIGDVFAEAFASPEQKAAALRHVWYRLKQSDHGQFRIDEAFANWKRMIEAAARRRAKALRSSEGAAIREAANG